MTDRDGDRERKRVLLLLALAGGASKHAAAGKAGVTYRTFARWMLEAEFADAVEVALGAGRALYEELLRKAGERDWRAAFALYEAIYLDHPRPGRGSSNATYEVPESPSLEPDVSEEATLARFRAVYDILEEAGVDVVELMERRMRDDPDLSRQLSEAAVPEGQGERT